ncbi:MAG: hypothetical protein E7603_10665 [Ruminococcaceae bacterium]|nr:hypothetical protein [Oscillospiraceae bacterium]
MKKQHKIRSAFGRILAVLILTALFSAVILSSAFVLYATKGIDASLDLNMLIDNQGRTTKLYYHNADGEWIEMEDQRLFGAENRIWTMLENIPIDVQNAFIAIEDHRFFDHCGVDFRRTAGAILGFLSPGGAGYGGSTITQQLIKNLTGDNSATPKRKITEIMRALKLEKTVGKDVILELYLNTVYLAEGCYGLETAAETYFGKSASELTAAEGASLAAIIQYPTRYDPVTHPENNRERRDTILWRMHELGLLETEAYEEALQTETVLHLNEKEEESAQNSWFTEVVIEDVIHDLCKTYGLSRAAASGLLYNGGLSIYTTLDMKMQKAVEAYYENVENFPKSKEGARANSSCVLIDPKSGRLLAVAGAVGEKKSDRIFNLATQMLRSPGSVIKPISVYAPAIEKDIITWASVYDDVPVTFTPQGKGYALWPKNNPRVYSGLTTVNAALSKSTNTVAVRILQQLGVQTSFRFAKTLGLSTLIEKENGTDGKILSDVALAPLALGAVTKGVSVREMTGAYGALANGGVFHETVSYTSVYDKDGNLLLSHEEDGKEVFSGETADLMTKLLKNVVSDGTASDLHLQKFVPIAGKTGTSNANTDRWFIGYTPDVLCGVWYGYQDARDIGTHKKNPAVLIFDGLLTKLYANQSAETVTLDKNHRFMESENVVRCLYCKDSGALPTSACTCDLRGHRLEYGYFKKGTEPKLRCDTHIFVDYDSKTKAVAAEHCPKENLIRVALIKNYHRSFPCEITVTDAPYTYRHLPFGAVPSKNENVAFFQSFYEKDGNYIGIGSGKHAPNCYCAEHEHPPEETESETAKETEPMETEFEQIREKETEMRETEREHEQTEAKAEKKRLIPWRFSKS